MGRLYQRLAAALLWLAAFSFACGVFFSITLLFRHLPPTDPVAIGRVTIERYSKLEDYLGAAIFLLLVPPLTVWFQHLGRRLLEHEQRRFWTHRSFYAMSVTVLFTVPFLLAPLFYLTTGKVGWILLLPLALSYGGVRAFQLAVARRWIRELFSRELYPYHALIFCEGLAWILYRYLVTGRRIAHYRTLLLETVFVAVFLILVWLVAVLVSRLAELNFGARTLDVFRRVATAALPMTLLPLIPLVWVPTTRPALVVIGTLLIVVVLALRLQPLRPDAARKLAAYVILPVLIYCVSYASTAQLSQWIDLFHRGESVGPASDYLRGKTPYRDVFALHGMLEDGLLDAWLMQLFGRSIDVAIARNVIVGGFLAVSLWYLGIAIFESIPLSLLVVAMGAWTTAENNRTFFQVAAVALFWMALKSRRALPAVASGLVAGVALFFSYEIGLYTIAGALLSCAVIAFAARRTEWRGLEARRAAAMFVVGLLIGTAPFVAYLLAERALVDFARISFITIPRIIDAVWSLPFPDLVSTFRKDLNLHALAEFVLWERFHLILSPLTIAVAGVYTIQRVARRRLTTLDAALLVLTIFALITQRTAFGRAEFRHQYFAAFLIGPILVALGLLMARRLGQVWSDGEEGTRAFVVAVMLGAIPVIGVLFWIPDLINARIDDVLHYQRRVLRVFHDPHAEEVKHRIDTISQIVDELTRPDEPIFDFSNQPAFYFFANRPNPTRFYQIPIASPPAFQAEIIRVLERSRPKVVIRTSPENFDEFDGVPNSVRAQAVAAYLDDCYRYLRSARGVEVWTRVRNARAAPLQTYLRRIRLPPKEELATSVRTRMIFPLIGSLVGAGESLWVSDLTLHNPYRDPISITMRYISGETRLDRHLTLSPRQTIRFPDVVRSYFGVTGRGTLWIEHREGRAPAAVVKIADVAREGRAALELPLTGRDAVSSGTDSAELTIVGIPRTREMGRRVNVGVVNMGLIPAGFQISARTRAGAPVGRSIDSGIPEDGLWLVGDIEDALGIRLDETMTIHVTALAGTGVAFATVTDASGDTQFIAGIPAQQR